MNALQDTGARHAAKGMGNLPQLSSVITVPGQRLRRTLFFTLIPVSTLLAAGMMFAILRANQLTLLETLILVLFVVSFAWIVSSFWTAIAGFILQSLGLDPLSLRRRLTPGQQAIVTRTALVMPVYNEEPRRVMAGVEAIYRELAASGASEHFDFFLLSDTTRVEIARVEERLWSGLRKRLGSERLFYRRRTSNEGRKAGNIAEFCRRWGGAYDFMVVLDADSLMTAQSILTLVRGMQANPRAGLIQTPPLPVRQQTFFGRYLQFSSALYSPMLSVGLAFWQGDTANYWGHNAIIRVAAFAAHCGLPTLPGKPPLGGEILSHDFVEAALVRRAGWHVYLLADLEGSYEEVPGDVIGYLQRDRRWAEGNMQHLRLLGAAGLHPLNRLYFLMGGLAYISSLLWLLMLVASTADAMRRAIDANLFFLDAHQLFPDWPIFETRLVIILLVVVAFMLLLPKVLSILLCLGNARRRRAFGGASRLLASALLEVLFSILIAPLMMVYHALFVTTVLCGRRVTWGTQNREGSLLSWDQALRATLLITLGALLWGACTVLVSPIFFYALLPVLVGLIVAAPLVRLSSSLELGEKLRLRGLLLTPEETRPAQVLSGLQEALRSPDPVVDGAETSLWTELVPAEAPLRMPTQRLAGWTPGDELGSSPRPI